MARAAPNIYSKENCRFADDTHLKVTFEEKMGGFRYYLCPLGSTWDFRSHQPFVMAWGTGDTEPLD